MPALAVLGMLLASLLTAPGAAAHTTSAYSHDSSTGTTYTDWMAALPDAKLLSRLSLPGTHDSGAYEFGEDSTETQSMDIATQLSAGIRAFDIRLGNNDVCPTSNGFYIFHGGICQFISFKDDVMTPMHNFLIEHEDETVVMRIKPEHGTDDDFASRVVTELTPYDGSMYKGGSSNPSLEDMRGKIVVLQNFGKIGDLAAITTAISYGAVDWQDNYSLGDNWDLADQLHDIKDQFSTLDAFPGTQDQIYGNFLSAAGGGFPYFFASGHSSPETGASRLATGWLWDNVTGSSCDDDSQCIDEYPRLDCTDGLIKTCTVYFEGLNILARDYINNSIQWRTGIVFADFPGAGLIKAIIDVNSRPIDTTAPTVTVPAAMTIEATSAAGATVTFAATATDADPASPAVGCAPASGSTFAIGTTTVNCSATDAAGNTGTASFTVTVKDTTPPVISGTPGDQTAEATGPDGAIVTYTTPIGYDPVDGIRAVDCAPASGSTFAIGATTVTCSATDAAGNTGSASFTVTIQDTTSPVISVPAHITDNATMPAGAIVSYSATASDAVDGTPAVNCAPPSGSTFAIGTTTVTCSATDAAGNTGTASFTVTVKGASQQLTDLHAKVQNLPLDPPTRKNLVSILQNVQMAEGKGNLRAACNQLSSFIRQVQAQSGKKIDMPTADDLIVDAWRIKEVLGCS